MNPHRDLAPAFLAPLVETVSGNNTTASIYERFERWEFRQCFSSRVYHAIADGWVCGPRRNQPPMHEPTLIAAFLTDNDGDVGGSLRCDVKARRVLW